MIIIIILINIEITINYHDYLFNQNQYYCHCDILLSDVGEPGSGQFEFLLNGICLQ